MISLLLEYPDNKEVIYKKLPLPNHISTKDLCLLTFPTILEYDRYVNEICDLIDELQFNYFFHHDYNYDILDIVDYILVDGGYKVFTAHKKLGVREIIMLSPDSSLSITSWEPPLPSPA